MISSYRENNLLYHIPLVPLMITILPYFPSLANNMHSPSIIYHIPSTFISSIRQDYSSRSIPLIPSLLRHILPIHLDCHSNMILLPRIVSSMNFECHCIHWLSNFQPIFCNRLYILAFGEVEDFCRNILYQIKEVS